MRTRECCQLSTGVSIIVLSCQLLKFTYVYSKGIVMYLVDNFLARCEARGESPSHALEAAGLSKSFLSKFKKYPDRVPQGDSLAKLANYLGCTIDDLLFDQKKSEISAKISSLVDKMTPEKQEYLLRYIQFTWSDLK